MVGPPYRRDASVAAVHHASHICRAKETHTHIRMVGYVLAYMWHRKISEHGEIAAVYRSRHARFFCCPVYYMLYVKRMRRGLRLRKVCFFLLYWRIIRHWCNIGEISLFNSKLCEFNVTYNSPLPAGNVGSLCSSPAYPETRLNAESLSCAWGC